MLTRLARTTIRPTPPRRSAPAPARACRTASRLMCRHHLAEQRPPGPRRGRSRSPRPPAACSRTMPTMRQVAHAHRLERAELVQVLQREQVKRLPGDGAADDEAERDGDAEVDRDAGPPQVSSSIVFQTNSSRVRAWQAGPRRPMRRQTSSMRRHAGFAPGQDERTSALRSCGHELHRLAVARVEDRERLKRLRRLAHADEHGPVVVHLE